MAFRGVVVIAHVPELIRMPTVTAGWVRLPPGVTELIVTFLLKIRLHALG